MTATAQVKEVRRVLFFAEGNLSSSAVATADQEIRAGLEKSPYAIEHYSEYTETVLFPREASHRKLREWYRDRKPDIIIASGPSAIKFLAESQEKLFGDTPIVFCGSSEEQADHPMLDSHFTGVWMTIDPTKTLEAALQLQPSTQHVVVVGGVSSYDRHVEAIVREQLRSYESNSKFEYLTDLVMPALFVRGANVYIFDWRTLQRWGFKESALPPGSIVLNRQPTVWQSHRRYILGAVLLCLAQTLLILGLLWQRARKREVERSLGERLAFETFRSDLSTTFINLPEEQVTSNIEKSLGRIAEFLEMDRITLFECSQLGQELTATSSWTSEGTEPVLPNSKPIPWPWWTGRGLSGEPVTFSDPHILPDEASHIRRYLLESGIQSIASVPLRIGGEIVGALSFVSTKRRVIWTEDLVTELKVLAEIFSNALKRKRTMEALLASNTELKRSEGVLRESEERFRLAAQAGKMFAYEWDATTDVIVRSAESTQILGVDEATHTTGQQIFARVHPDDRERLTAAVAKLSPEKPYLEISYRMVRPDGTVTWVERNSRAHFDEQGRMLRIIGMVADVTARKQAEDALRESEERFRLVANNAPVLIWMSGANKLCTFFNKGWLDFTGRSMEQELGEGWASGVHPDDLERCLRTYSAAFDARVDFEMEYRLRRFDREYRWIVDYGVPRFESNGTFCGYIGSCVDITDRKLAEVSLQELSGRLIHAQEEERARIARELHDDLNQRMALLQISLDQVAQDTAGLSSKTRQQLHDITKVSTEVSSNLHDLSHQLHPYKLDTLGLVPALGSFCNEFSRQHNLQVQFVYHDVPGQIPKEVTLCLFRIVQEALRNVVKHSGAAEAKVELSGHGDRIDLCISDSGAGFSPERVKAETGLGLISMRERLRLVRGHLSVESEPSHGTRIRARIPLPTSNAGVTNEKKAHKAGA